jgi:hypothetical protein
MLGDQLLSLTHSLTVSLQVVLLSMAVFRRVASTPAASTAPHETQVVDADGVAYTQLSTAHARPYTLPDHFFAFSEQGEPLH